MRINIKSRIKSILGVNIFIAIVVALILSACGVSPTQQVSNNAPDPSKFPLSPSDPNATVTIDTSLYKKITFNTNTTVYDVLNDGDDITLTYEADEGVVQTNQKALARGISKTTLTAPYQGLTELSDKKIQAKTIFGNDDRFWISDSTQWPYRTGVKLYMTFPNGDRFEGSGLLIGSRFVLTAGHCVYWAASGGWATSITVIPAQNGTYQPYGAAYAYTYNSVVGWTQSGNNNYDYGLITLDRNIGNYTGWAGTVALSDSTLNNLTLRSFGYPGDLNAYYGGQYLWGVYGTVSSYNSSRVFTKMDIYPGQSGSGVFGLNVGYNDYAEAIVSWQYSDINALVRITGARVNNFINWMNANASLPAVY